MIRPKTNAVASCLSVCQSGVESSPGVKERPVQQRAVVVVAHVVGDLHLPGASGRRVVGVDLDAVLRVPHVKQQDVKVEDGIGRDDVT